MFREFIFVSASPSDGSFSVPQQRIAILNLLCGEAVRHVVHHKNSVIRRCFQRFGLNANISPSNLFAGFVGVIHIVNLQGNKSFRRSLHAPPECRSPTCEWCALCTPRETYSKFRFLTRSWPRDSTPNDKAILFSRSRKSRRCTLFSTDQFPLGNRTRFRCYTRACFRSLLEFLNSSWCLPDTLLRV